jgi:hypothetical protein
LGDAVFDWLRRVVGRVLGRREPEAELPEGVEEVPPEELEPPGAADREREEAPEEGEPPADWVLVVGTWSVVTPANYRQTFLSEDEALAYLALIDERIGHPIPDEYVALVLVPGPPPEWRLYVQQSARQKRSRRRRG